MVYLGDYDCSELAAACVVYDEFGVDDFVAVVVVVVHGVDIDGVVVDGVVVFADVDFVAAFVDDVSGADDVLYRLPFPEDDVLVAWRRSQSSLASKL